MMIPKNRDNSGTALLYIVGPDVVRPGFRPANLLPVEGVNPDLQGLAGNDALLGVGCSTCYASELVAGNSSHKHTARSTDAN